MRANQQRFNDVFYGIVGLEYSWLDRVRIAFMATVVDRFIAVREWLAMHLGV